MCLLRLAEIAGLFAFVAAFFSVPPVNFANTGLQMSAIIRFASAEKWPSLGTNSSRRSFLDKLRKVGKISTK